MATNRRDIELLISAKETTGRSFKQVTDNIDALNKKIGQQIDQAERGEISLRELRDTQEALAAAGRDLSSLQSQIDAYNRLVASQDKVAAAYKKAQDNLAAHAAKIAESGKATDAQEAKLQKLEVAVVKTSAAFEKNQSDIAEQAAVLGRAGIAVNELAGAQTNLVGNARQVGAALVQVNSAIDNFGDSVRLATQKEKLALAEAKAAEIDFANEQTFQKKLVDASKLAEAADYTAFWVRALDAAEEKERTFAAQQTFDKKVAAARQLGDASRFVQLFGDAVQTVNAQDNQLSALTGFRAVGQMASEAANDMSRFVQSGQSMVATTSQVAAGLRAIIDPGQAVLQTLDGVENAIRQAGEAANGETKNVGALNDAYNQLSAASAALLRQGGLVDTFRQQEAVTEAARQQFRAAASDVQRLGQAMAVATVPTEEMVRDLQQAETRLEEAGRAMAQEETRLGTLSRELKTAGINTRDLANEQARLTTAAQTAAGSMGKINQTLGRGGQKTNGLFGLKPNDLANLNFQLNDIFVSLSSGQSPLTVLIQQGSQIGQLFPGIISTIAKFAARWFPLIAILTAVGAAMFEVYNDSVRLKQAQEDLAAIPTGEGLDPKKFAAAQEAMENMGASAEDARKSLLLLAQEGFSDAELAKYSETASQLAERLGVDVTEATQMLVDIQKGGIETVLELTGKTHDLTDADLDHADALFKAGKSAEARQYILDRVAERNQQIAEATRSVWTPAIKNLQSAWEGFSSWLGRQFEPILKGINDGINASIVGFTYLTGLLAGKGFAGAQADAFSAIERLRAAGKPDNKPRTASDQSLRDRQFAADTADDYQITKKLTAEERLRAAATEARAKAQAAGVSKAQEDLYVQKALTAEQSKINDDAEKASKRSDAAGKRAQAARDKAARAAKAEADRRASAQRELEGQLRNLDRAAFTGASAPLEERLKAIDLKYQTIYNSIKKVQSLGITQTADGTDLKTVLFEVEATKQRLKDEETIKFYQQEAALLAKQRSAELETITDAQKRGAIDTEEAMRRTAEVNERISPKIVAAAQKALEIAKILGGARPSPEMVSWIASLERLVTGEATSNPVADIGLAGLNDTSTKLNTLLKERDDLVASYKELGDIGLKTEADVRNLTASAYARQAEAIKPVLAALRQQVELLHATMDPLTNLPVLTDTAYNTWLAKLQAVDAGLAQIDPRLQQINSAATQAIQNGVVKMFNTAAQSIAGLINGTKSFGDVLGDLGRAALSVFASILEAIGQVLIQLIAVSIAKKILGAGSGGLGFLLHDGGVVGAGGGSHKTRTGGAFNPALWTGAPKFHGGGGLGLGPEEYRAVLKRGEEVLTDDDPRHIRNIGKGGGGSSKAPSIKQVLYMDPSHVAAAMQGSAGQQSILTTLRLNKETVKQMLK